ncbi:hypothetical protein Cob_v001468 [Colletotrichum orbiculare MAFF 240422]|uniref:Uncharacterized protein n=1 Tax=Colletotrichum orbiculare (strain 104-T / ATCC 96160 / CBS 514.97 / LARS 414 / MAFF 240422) TaxID=1213857 RepID=A0A484G7Q5_COLOR|nr:hypothetical protein Cob_v001468 [Colletotrichum orbiculare MAFF 240422]
MAEGDFIFGRSGDYVVVTKPKGIVFVEARFKDNHTHTDKGCQQVMALLERELSPDRLDGNTIITLESDLLGTVLYEGVPRDMFHSLRVVEFQGLDPSTIVVPARDSAQFFHTRCWMASGSSVDSDEPVAWSLNRKIDPSCRAGSRTTRHDRPAPFRVSQRRPSHKSSLHSPRSTVIDDALSNLAHLFIILCDDVEGVVRLSDD